MCTYILAGLLVSSQRKTSKFGAYGVTGATERASAAPSRLRPCARAPAPDSRRKHKPPYQGFPSSSFASSGTSGFHTDT
jgi:hypothetical protein